VNNRVAVGFLSAALLLGVIGGVVESASEAGNGHAE
jgi:hypothetical protein